MNRILHIDDNSDFRDAFKTAIACRGEEVRGCANSRDAARLIPLKDYNIVVTDSSGFKYCQNVGPLVNSVFVAVLSSRATVKPEFKVNLVLSKTDPEWEKKLDLALNLWLAAKVQSDGIDHRKSEDQNASRMDVFPYSISDDQRDVFSSLSEEELQAYTDKVLVIAVKQNRIIFEAASLLEAKELVKKSPFANEMCRYVPGPPAVPYTLQEIEQD